MTDQVESVDTVELPAQPSESVPAAAEPIVATSKAVAAKAAADTKKKRVSDKAKMGKDKIFNTEGGFAVKFHPVAANVIREAQVRIPDPLIRTFDHPTTGAPTENPAHPDYIREMAEVKETRTKAAMNAMLLFGLELVDPIPAENDWLKKLLYLGLITQPEFDEAVSEDGKFLRELFFKNYVVSDLTVLKELQAMSGITEEMVAEARKSFQRST